MALITVSLSPSKPLKVTRKPFSTISFAVSALDSTSGGVQLITSATSFIFVSRRKARRFSILQPSSKNTRTVMLPSTLLPAGAAEASCFAAGVLSEGAAPLSIAFNLSVASSSFLNVSEKSVGV